MRSFHGPPLCHAGHYTAPRRDSPQSRREQHRDPHSIARLLQDPWLLHQSSPIGERERRSEDETDEGEMQRQRSEGSSSLEGSYGRWWP